jgi:hypothetical protein
MQVRRLRVQIETERLQIKGTLQLPTEGYRSRTTDFLNANETGFIALTDAELTSVTGGEPESRAYVAVGCRHIAALHELEDLGVAEDDAYIVGIGGESVPPPPAS